MTQQYDSLPQNFIPAQESRWFMRGFRWYVRWLFYRQFDTVWLRQDYQPDPSESTIYYLNHTSWWDGLIPFLLNEFQLRQQARAVMEDKQMREFPFFSRIGAFSINRSNPRSALKSLSYGLKSLEPGGRSLFIYPEGKIHSAVHSPAEFEGGLAWMASHISSLSNPVRIVPVGIFMHTMLSDKPQLLLNLASPVSYSGDLDKSELTSLFEHHLSQAINELVTHAQEPEEYFTSFP